MPGSSVVRNRSKVTEGDFHNAIVAGLARAAVSLGRGGLADHLDMSSKALQSLRARIADVRKPRAA